MITNIGKNILAKYLIGQASSYASHIAVGCGASPKSSSYSFTTQDTQEVLDKDRLDFEMFRVPIISRGYINEGGDSRIVLTAELPTIERYEITEIGIFSSGYNPTAGASDSKPVYTFSQSENWEYHTQSFAVDVPTIISPLGTQSYPNVISDEISPVFQTNADNPTLINLERALRYESCRYLNNTVFIAGDEATISYSGSKMIPAPGSNHIHLTGASLDLNKNSPSDELRLAFSVVSKDGDSNTPPSRVRLLVEFASSDSDNPNDFAQFQVDIENGIESNQHDFENNRYVVVAKKLSELVKSASFTWSSVSVVKVFASVLDSLGAASSDYYVALDAIRLENIDSQNPLYGMTGYSVIKTPDSLPVIKVSNTANLIEFRFALDVDFGE